MPPFLAVPRVVSWILSEYSFTQPLSPQSIHGIFVGILRCLGFRKTIQRDSYASRYQSTHYRGHIPKESTFSSFQTYAALAADAENNEEEEPQGMLSGLVGCGLFITGIKIAINQAFK
ncbi:hypothetical protein CVT25_007217 [Psilocybe cyanescens]|uniref:Uncharacterized protein n=1 Tax=Psilocybe cyanescens TaxID=93625 RepID=A0A409X6Z9_PSICY|nr:hypothetical protein CVT25_007217 [Psilocybe cyanescens]